jgi:hypothetical protein
MMLAAEAMEAKPDGKYCFNLSAPFLMQVRPNAIPGA